MIHRIRTLFRDSSVRRDLLRYAAGWVIRAGRPRMMMQGVVFGNFASFTDFHCIKMALSPEDAWFMQSWRLPEGDIIDVGASYGVWSLPLARRFPGRRIHAIEASRTIADALKGNCALNGIANVEVHNLAVTDRDGPVCFESARVGSYASHLARPGHGACSVHCNTEGVTLDSFCSRQGITRVGFLKVDVEGFEAAVFKGAAGLLRGPARPVIMFEVCPGLARLAGFDPLRPMQILGSLGYSFARLGPEGPSPVVPGTACLPDIENWLALPDGTDAIQPPPDSIASTSTEGIQ